MGILQRKAVRVGLGLLVMVVLGPWLVKLVVPAEKVRDLALAQAEARLGREVEVGEVSVSLRGGLGVRLADIVVHNPPGFGGEPLLRADGLELKLALRPLRKREIRITRLVLDAPDLQLRRRADGTDNFTFTSAGAGDETAPSSGAGSTAPALSVSDFGVQGGRLDFRAVSSAGDTTGLALDGCTLDLTLTDPMPQQYRVAGRLAADHVLLRAPQAPPAFPGAMDFALTWQAADSRLELMDVRVDLAGLSADLAGAVDITADGPRGTLRVGTTDQPVAALRTFLPAGIAGHLADADDGGRFDLDVTMELADGRPRTTGSVTGRGVDLALAQPFLPPERPGRVAGLADLSLVFSDRTGDPADLVWSGAGDLRGVSYRESGLIDDLLRLDGEFELSPQELRVPRARAEFGAGTVDLTATLSDPLPWFLPPELQGDGPVPVPHLVFTLRSDHVDVDRLLPAASPTGAGDGTAPGMTRRTPVPDGVVFPGLTGSGTVQADTVVYLQVPFTSLTGNVEIGDRVVSVRDVRGEVYRGRVAGGVDVDLGDLANPGYEGLYAARGIEVNDFLARFAGLSGVLYGGCDFGGEFAAQGLDADVVRQSLTLDAAALIKQGRLVTRGKVQEALVRLADETGGGFDGEQALRDLAGQVSVADGRVGIEELTTRLGDFADLSCGGSYGFDGTLDYTGALVLSAARTDALFAGAGVLGELGRLLGAKRPARLEVPISIGGTRDDPQVKIALGAVLGDLQKAALREQEGRLQDEAKKKLGDLLNKWK